MDLHSKMTMYITSTMTSPVTKTAKTSKWLRLQVLFHRNSPPKDFYKEDFGLSCNLKLLGYGRNLISYSEPFMNQQEKRFWPHSRNTHRNPLDKKTLQFLEHYLHSFVLDRQFISFKVSKLGQKVGTISKNLVGTIL